MSTLAYKLLGSKSTVSALAAQLACISGENTSVKLEVKKEIKTLLSQLASYDDWVDNIVFNGAPPFSFGEGVEEPISKLLESIKTLKGYLLHLPSE